MVTFARIFSIFLVVFLPIQLIPLHDQGWAQENKSGQNQVKLSVFFLPEKEACRKKGYENYHSEKQSHCETLTRDDLNRWKDDGKLCTEIKIPAQQHPPVYISLGQKCYDDADKYPLKPNWNPAERESVVMGFEWEQPQTGAISLEREDLTDPPSIPYEIWKGNLTNEKLWINHSRVDGFFPRSNVKWTLRLGGEKWIFVFKAKE